MYFLKNAYEFINFFARSIASNGKILLIVKGEGGNVPRLGWKRLPAAILVVISPRRKHDCLYGGRKGPLRWR